VLFGPPHVHHPSRSAGPQGGRLAMSNCWPDTQEVEETKLSRNGRGVGRLRSLDLLE
jgi:hypothetical protein